MSLATFLVTTKGTSWLHNPYYVSLVPLVLFIYIKISIFAEQKKKKSKTNDFVPVFLVAGGMETCAQPYYVSQQDIRCKGI